MRSSGAAVFGMAGLRRSGVTEKKRPMDRFSAYLLLRTHVRRPSGRRRARRMEAIVEAIAAHQPAVDRDRWAMMAILSQLDHEYGEHNPDARGTTAADQAALEGVDSQGCAVLACWRDEGFPASLDDQERSLVAALRVAEEIVDGLVAGAPEGASAEGADLDLGGLERDGLARAVATHLQASVGALSPGGERPGRMAEALSLLGVFGEDVTALAAVVAEGLWALEEVRP